MTDTTIGFNQKKLQIQLTLKKGTFKDGANSKIIKDLSMTASVEKLGPPDFGKASVSITNMRLDDMEKLSTLSFHPLFVNRNYINIFAGSDATGYSQIFAGTITKAGTDFSSPDKAFKIDAQLGFFGSVKSADPSSINGTMQASNFIKNMADKALMKFENQGVNLSVKNCVFNGSPIQQARQCAQQAGAELIIDDDVMILKPSDKARKGQVIELSKDSGLLNYPSITQNGIELKAIFNPNFKFGSLFNLKTIVPKCTGTWRIVKLTHALSSNNPTNGQWESSITGFYPQFSSVYGRL